MRILQDIRQCAIVCWEPTEHRKTQPVSFVRAGRVARHVNFLRLLGGMTISSLPDMARPDYAAWPALGN